MFKLEKFYTQDFDRQQYWEDKYARDHIAGAGAKEFEKQGFWPLLKKNLVEGKTYLDAGCGIGGWIIFLREEGYTVEGIDSAARTIRALSEYDRDMKLKIAGINAIPYADNSLDGVLAIGTLEYFEDEVPIALQEVRRVLKDDALFFIEVPIANVLRRLFYIPLKRVEKFFRQAQGRQATFANYLFGRDDFVEMLEGAGFEVHDTEPHDLPDANSHYGLYVDWPFFRGSKPHTLNVLGRIVKVLCNAISPWVAATGMVVVARKKSSN